MPVHFLTFSAGVSLAPYSSTFSFIHCFQLECSFFKSTLGNRHYILNSFLPDIFIMISNEVIVLNDRIDAKAAAAPKFAVNTSL